MLDCPAMDAPDPQARANYDKWNRRITSSTSVEQNREMIAALNRQLARIGAGDPDPAAPELAGLTARQICELIDIHHSKIDQLRKINRRKAANTRRRKSADRQPDQESTSALVIRATRLQNKIEQKLAARAYFQRGLADAELALELLRSQLQEDMRELDGRGVHLS